MKKLVIGSAGFIGSQLTKRLLSEGNAVIGIDSFDETLYPSESRRFRAADQIASGLEFIEGDASLLPLRKILDEVDVVFNLAAVPGLAPSWGKFDNYIKSNLILVEHLLSELSQCPHVFLVHASTSSVYGSHAEGESNLSPISPYGVSKLAAENLINAYSNAYGIRNSILRYFSVYGPQPRPDQFFSIIMDKLKKGEEIRIFGDGSNSRAHTFIDDIVDATIKTANLEPHGSTLDIAGSEVSTTLQVVNFVADEMGIEAKIMFAPPRLGDQIYTRGHAESAMKILGWVPATSIRDGIRKMVRSS